MLTILLNNRLIHTAVEPAFKCFGIGTIFYVPIAKSMEPASSSLLKKAAFGFRNWAERSKQIIKAMEKQPVIEVLNDLIRINRDRSDIYENAIEKLDDDASADITETFSEMAHKSQVFMNELSTSVLQLKGEPGDDREDSGRVYKLWKDLKSTFSIGKDKSVLEFCEFGEDAALRAYNEAIEMDIDYPDEVKDIIVSQMNALENSHETVKQYRDAF